MIISLGNFPSHPVCLAFGFFRIIFSYNTRAQFQEQNQVEEMWHTNRQKVVKWQENFTPLLQPL